ncbi:CRP-like cAMP-binding protein [Ancylobacter sp. 3268]|uniref:Crp/Fnr family transcriptional regulator n=1 Tax=Ancylobacter sp. 3268 TaxID=2817752 RepID=UPI002857FC64|nr:Crp/Fnr family transcriptional regulator [Ancylobacter sp. 3268]MDR6954873.1 CRP-like cAMP-binding protein [Ancylobacter sp. 3268]
MNGSDIHSLLRKLDAERRFTRDEMAALLELPIQIATLQPGDHIVREGDRPTKSCLIIEGLVCASKTTARGSRQIASLYVPGDIPDLQSLHLEVMDISFEAISPAKIGFISHSALRRICDSFPRLASALWRTTLVDAAIYRDWVTNVGQRDSDSRLAHLFCELTMRLDAVGLVQEDGYDLPLTQTDLADALGISVVHVNRTLQRLRRLGLISFKNKRLTVLDWPQLAEMGDFEPSYLHLSERV